MKNENQPLVSIGLLIFNGENGMACAIDSLVEQGYSNLELIISDNGSTGATPDKFNSDAGFLSNEPQICPPCYRLV